MTDFVSHSFLIFHYSWSDSVWLPLSDLSLSLSLSLSLCFSISLPLSLFYRSLTMTDFASHSFLIFHYSWSDSVWLTSSPLPPPPPPRSPPSTLSISLTLLLSPHFFFKRSSGVVAKTDSSTCLARHASVRTRCVKPLLPVLTPCARSLDPPAPDADHWRDRHCELEISQHLTNARRLNSLSTELRSSKIRAR